MVLPAPRLACYNCTLGAALSRSLAGIWPKSRPMFNVGRFSEKGMCNFPVRTIVLAAHLTSLANLQVCREVQTFFLEVYANFPVVHQTSPGWSHVLEAQVQV